MKGRQHLIFWAVLLAVALAVLITLSGILLPFAAGFAIAYFLDPLADRLEAARFPRWLATLTVLIGFFATLLALGFLLVPVIDAQFDALVRNFPKYIDRVVALLEPWKDRILMILGEEGDVNAREAAGTIARSLAGWAGDVVRSLLSGGLFILNLLSLLFITPIVSFFLLRDWDVIVTKIDGWLPRASADTIREQFRQIDRVLAGYLRGQLTICLILATLFAIAWSAIGLDFAIVLALFSGLLAFIPYVGYSVGATLATLIALGQFGVSIELFLTIGSFIVVQMIEGNLITPRLMGGKVGLHPLWIVFALLAGGYLFGFLGVLLATPVAAVVGVLARFALARYKESNFYHGGRDDDAVQSG